MNKSYKCVVPVSGGKDSQTCLKLAVDYFGSDNVIGMFCDTKFEHPLTYAHIDYMKLLYNVDIITLNSGSVVEQVIRWGRFPGGGARFCTDYLKIKTGKLFYKELAEKQGGFEVWYGIRSDESNERSKRYNGKVADELYAPHEFLPSKYPKYLGKMGVQIRLPIIDWGTDDVINFLDGDENPLYRQGFDRVGCFPCLAGGDKWKEKAFNHDEFGKSQYETVMILEDIIEKDVFTSKGGKERNKRSCETDGSGCSFCSM